VNNIDNYRKKFFSLLESEIGNVKPLLVESGPTPKQQTKIKNSISTDFLNLDMIGKVNISTKALPK